MTYCCGILVRDGLVDREGVGGLAARLGYSERQVHRLLVGELGVGEAGGHGVEADAAADPFGLAAILAHSWRR